MAHLETERQAHQSEHILHMPIVATLKKDKPKEEICMGRVIGNGGGLILKTFNFSSATLSLEIHGLSTLKHAFHKK